MKSLPDGPRADRHLVGFLPPDPRFAPCRGTFERRAAGCRSMSWLRPCGSQCKVLPSPATGAVRRGRKSGKRRFPGCSSDDVRAVHRLFAVGLHGARRPCPDGRIATALPVTRCRKARRVGASRRLPGPVARDVEVPRKLPDECRGRRPRSPRSMRDRSPSANTVPGGIEHGYRKNSGLRRSSAARRGRPRPASCAPELPAAARPCPGRPSPRFHRSCP